MYSNKWINRSWKNFLNWKDITKRKYSQQAAAAIETALNNGGQTNKTEPVKVKPVFRCANEFADSIALHDINGEFTYRSLFKSSVTLSKEINQLLAHKRNERVAFLCPNDASYVITQWASWMSGQTVVPLSKLHPPNLLEYYISDSGSQLLITTSEYSELFSSLAKKSNSKLLVLNDDMLKDIMVPVVDKKIKTDLNEVDERPPPPEPPLDAGLEPEFYHNNPAIFIYTSGTTGPPKGVVLTHDNICAQVGSMVSSWEWTNKDVLLHCLPLHHIHGVVNALITPLSVGAKCIMLPFFSANEVWMHLMAIKKQPSDRINMFMGVPTMYSKLVQEFDQLFEDNKRQSDFIRATLSQRIRLMISGSAPLPAPLSERWKEISGHTLLERYGMSECGMILSNPLHGPRIPSSVGRPLPSVRVRIQSKEEPQKILAEGDATGSSILEKMPDGRVSGELLVSGPTVFKEYWNKPKATEKSFTGDGWFKTGDTVELVDDHYVILGRTSVDIIKTGGFKVSALQVETDLLAHDDIADVAVLGVPDVTWGEKVAAVIVLKKDKTLTLPSLREWAKARLAPYAVPTELKLVLQIPRNAMGKINKKELLRDLFSNQK